MTKYLLVLLLFIQGCSKKDIIHQDKYNFNNYTWKHGELLEFDFNITNTEINYEIDFHITYSDYLYRNIIFFSYFYKDTILIQKDTVNIDLFDKYGKPKGKGMTDLKKLTYRKNKIYNFTSQGVYKLKIEQSFRVGNTNKLDSLRSLRSLGFEIKKK
mgnify:CR=1 FL=1|tara:strand:+ start:106 stop:576 length:471 start_codon:yes stop_codon:yes gene_type:complete